MRTLSAALLSAVGATVTRPGWLVRIEFATPATWSSIGTVDWLGATWAGRQMRISGLSADASASSAGRLEVTNIDDGAAALILAEGIADRRIRIWACYADATADADVVLVFDGVGDDASLDERSASITLSAASTRTLYAPRRWISPGTGFNHLQPVGTKIRLGSQPYILER
jgi:hypothetical protein